MSTQLWMTCYHTTSCIPILFDSIDETFIAQKSNETGQVFYTPRYNSVGVSYWSTEQEARVHILRDLESWWRGLKAETTRVEALMAQAREVVYVYPVPPPKL